MPDKEYQDQTGRTVSLPVKPVKIISLVPSQTELLYSLGLDQEVAGITKFCIHPDIWFRTKSRVGGTKSVNPDKVRSIAPDLILANKEENLKDEIELLARDFPVWVSDISNLEESLEMIRMVGEITGTSGRADSLAKEILTGFANLQPLENKPSCAYLIWKGPLMTVGGDTFIGDILRRCGLVNLFGDSDRYPETSLEELADLAPDFILLSSEPYPFSEKHLPLFTAACKNSKVLLVDGEMFSWYGSRLNLAHKWLGSFLGNIHPAG